MKNVTRSEARRAYLTKAASNVAVKQAGLVTDWAATLPSQVVSRSIPLVGLANLGGHVGGLITDPEDKKNPRTHISSVIPGVGQYRLAQRSRRVADASDEAGAKGGSNLVAEVFGPLTSSLLPGAAGAYAGYKIGDRFKSKSIFPGTASADNRFRRIGGAVAGFAAGVLVPELIGSIVAGIRRKRSLKEQYAADTTGRAVAKYVVPGLATYDSYKRLGASTHLDEDTEANKSQKTKKQASANRPTFTDFMDTYRGAGTYHNALQPHNVLAAGGIGGGAYLLGSAVNPMEERTTQDRILRALGGAALAGGGAYLAANKDVRERLSSAVYRLIGKAKRALA